MTRWRKVLGVVALTPFLALRAFAQPDSSVTSTSGSSATTTTTTSSSVWISDWRLWAVVGAVLVIILVIALTRGKGDADRTTIVK
jgi:hypothetical protein